MSHNTLVSDILDWLVDKALADSDIVVLFEELCIRLNAIGIPVARGRMIWQTLHPLFQAEIVLWQREEQAHLTNLNIRMEPARHGKEVLCVSSRKITFRFSGEKN